MRRTAFAVALCIGSTLLPPVASAQDENRPTKLTADFGLVKTDGNSEVTTLSGTDKLEHSSGRWLFTQDAVAVWGVTDGVESAARYGAGLRADYKLNDRLATYGLATWKRNTFAGIARQFDENVGLAWKAINVKPQSLDVELGAGRVQRQPTIGEDDAFTSARTGLAYVYEFSEKSKFTTDAYYSLNLEDTEDSDGEARFGLSAPIGRSFALKLGYDLLYRNKPLPGLEKTDTTLSMGVQVTY
jgi:putative salt-induced outer membrane protein